MPSLFTCGLLIIAAAAPCRAYPPGAFLPAGRAEINPDGGLPTVPVSTPGISRAELEDRKIANSRDVVVCIQQMHDTRVHEATRIATAIFDRIGVRLEWRLSTQCPPAPGAIDVSFSSEPPKQAHADALAYAFPFEGNRIVILKDHVSAVSSPTSLCQLMAYVLVHEIAHILQGLCRHAPEGIMKARWTSLDHFHMIDHSLSFSPEDIDLIYYGLDSRFAKAR